MQRLGARSVAALDADADAEVAADAGVYMVTVKAVANRAEVRSPSPLAAGIFMLSSRERWFADRPRYRRWTLPVLAAARVVQFAAFSWTNNGWRA
ncbi:hypothetical protein GCM10022419_097210 [Nonomuraea rosea]|uniref:Uncharacterized protein n=1 Tax=Nonomuraea rosea TaxID=638574 RepID=A0ABP6Z4Z4_9ACTN